MTNIEMASHLELLSESWYSEEYGDILREAAIRLRDLAKNEDYSTWEGNTGRYRDYDVRIQPSDNKKGLYLISISKGPIMQYVAWRNDDLGNVRNEAIAWIDKELAK